MVPTESAARQPSLLRAMSSLVPDIPLPLALLLLSIAIGLALGLDDTEFVAAFNQGYGLNLGYFAIILLCSFFLASAMSTGNSFSLGRLSVLTSPFTGAGMVCPDTSYAALAPISRGYRREVAAGSYAGFKLLIPAGPLIIGVSLSADVGAPGFALAGAALLVPTVLAGLLWLRTAGADQDDGERSADRSADRRHAIGAAGLRRLFPLFCLAGLLIAGFSVDFASYPVLKFLTAPIGALIVTAALTYALIAPEVRRPCLDSAMRRTASLLLVIGAATALGAMLGLALPLAELTASLTSVHSEIVLVIMLFTVTALFKMISGSSMATFAAAPPILAPIVAASTLDVTVAVYAICLGSFLAILPNDSFFWLTQPAAAQGAGRPATDFTFTGVSVVQGLTGLACLCGYLLIAT